MNFGKKWILIVDGEKELRDSLREIVNLTFSRHTKVVESKDGVEATGKVSQQAFDCIVTSLKIPRKDGRALISSIRQNQFNNRTPVIVLAEKPDLELEETTPFIYFLEKPIDHQKFSSLLDTQLKIGKDGSRIGADILNLMLEAVGLFMKRIFGQADYTLESPRAKPRGEVLPQQFISRIEFTIDDMHYTFAVICSLEVLDKLSESKGHLGKDPLLLVSAIGRSALKYVIKSMGFTEIRNLRCKSCEMQKSPETLQDQAGIIIPVQSDKSFIEIFASVTQQKY